MKKGEVPEGESDLTYNLGKVYRKQNLDKVDEEDIGTPIDEISRNDDSANEVVLKDKKKKKKSKSKIADVSASRVNDDDLEDPVPSSTKKSRKRDLESDDVEESPARSENQDEDQI